MERNYQKRRDKTFIRGVFDELKWNEQTGLEYAEYTKDNALYKIWLENSKSLAMKLETVNSHKMAGAAFWKAGMEKKNVWDTIEKYMAQ